MDPRDALPHWHCAVHSGKLLVRQTGQARRPNVDRSKYCQLSSTDYGRWFIVLASTLVEPRWRHVATIDGPWWNFLSPEFGTKLHIEVSLFLEVLPTFKRHGVTLEVKGSSQCRKLARFTDRQADRQIQARFQYRATNLCENHTLMCKSGCINAE